jgi:hypothetical protein
MLEAVETTRQLRIARGRMSPKSRASAGGLDRLADPCDFAGAAVRGAAPDASRGSTDRHAKIISEEFRPTAGGQSANRSKAHPLFCNVALTRFQASPAETRNKAFRVKEAARVITGTRRKRTRRSV